MRNLIRTEDDALLLIEATHRDPRPAPYDEVAFSEQRKWFEGSGIEKAPAVQIISHFCQMTGDTPDWDPTIHLEEIERFLIESLGEEQAENRREELEQGSSLTVSEYEAFVQTWEENGGTRVFHLYRVGSPFAKSSEKRSIYFLCEHCELGPYSDLKKVTGPLRSLEGFPVSSRVHHEFLRPALTDEDNHFQRLFFAGSPVGQI